MYRANVADLIKRDAKLIPRSHLQPPPLAALVAHPPRAASLALARPTTTHTHRLVVLATADVPSTSTPSALPTVATLDANWTRALELFRSGEAAEYTVKGFNRGGLKVLFGDVKKPIQGFIPFALLDPKRIPAGKVRDAEVTERVAASLVGKKLRAKVTRVDVPARDLILSERDISLDSKLEGLQMEMEVDVVVKNITDFGVFCTIQGGDFDGVDGLIWNRDVSWDVVTDASKVLRVGEALRVQVTGVDRPRKRVTLSARAMQRDPLYETLEEVMPVEGLQLSSIGSSKLSLSGRAPMEGLDFICAELLKEEGITAVAPGRQAEERRVVSQDLELWLTNQKVEDGYNLVVRAGKRVQEVHVSTRLDREAMKKTLQVVLKRLP